MKYKVYFKNAEPIIVEGLGQVASQIVYYGAIGYERVYR